MARSTGVRQRCGSDCQPRCRVHRWEFHVELPADEQGKRRQFTRGGFLTARDAGQARAQVLAQYRAGTLPRVDRRETVRAYLERWYANKLDAGQMRASTATAYRGHLDRYLLPHLGSIRLHELRGDHIERMFKAIRAREGMARPVGPTTERRILATLRSAISDAVRRRDLPHNSAAQVTLRPSEPRRVRPWTPDEFWRFVGLLEGQDEHTAAGRLLPLVLVAAGTGLRLGEVTGLRWADVDLDGGWLVAAQQAQQVGRDVTYVRPKTRAGEDRRVALAASTVEVLRSWRARQSAARLAWGGAWQDSGLVFTASDGQPLMPFSVSRSFSRLVAAYGMPHMTFHGLRHLYITVLLLSGVPMAVVSKLAGHSSIQLTVNTYGHLLDEAAVDAAQHVDVFMARPRALP